MALGFIYHVDITATFLWTGR